MIAFIVVQGQMLQAAVCDLCGSRIWPQKDMANHLERHVQFARMNNASWKKRDQIYKQLRNAFHQGLVG